MSYMMGPSAFIPPAVPQIPISSIQQTNQQTNQQNNDVQLVDSPLDVTDIDFSKIKYFKKIDHDGKIIQYLKNEIVAYNDRLYYASEDVSSLYEPFEKSAVWNELRNIPNRRVQSMTKPTGYLRSGDRWFNTITNKEYVFQNIKNNSYWISH